VRVSEAIEALYDLNDTKAVDPMIQALNDNKTIVRSWAAAALKKLGWQIP
jgi:HEAT repeat protein